jgi:hypothetical protein
MLIVWIWGWLCELGRGGGVGGGEEEREAAVVAARDE